MSQKRYNTKEDMKDILEGLAFFESTENSNLVNPKEIKDLMDQLELKDKMPFIYDLINNLCVNREVRKKGGLTKEEFAAYIEEKMNDLESKDGINTLYEIFTDKKTDDLPMINFCTTAKEIGDNEKDQQIKELMEKAEMTGKELTFGEFYDIMRADENRPKNKNTNLNIKNVNQNQPKKENRYNYRRSRIEQNKDIKIEKPTYTYIEEKNVQKEKKPEDEKVEKKIVLTEIISSEKEVELPKNNIIYKYRNRNRQEKKEDEGNKKVYSYRINTKINNMNKVDNQKEEESNEEKGEGSDSKRYHRRYRESYKPNEQKTETTITFNRYRREYKK